MKILFNHLNESLEMISLKFLILVNAIAFLISFNEQGDGKQSPMNVEIFNVIFLSDLLS